MLLNNIFQNIKKVFRKNTKNNKDIECGKTYSIQDINKVETTPIYKNYNTIPIFFIKNNIDNLLNKTINNIKKYCEQINIGIEIEFYIDNLDYEKFVEITTFFCKENKIDIIGIDKEWGNNQIEIKFNKYSNINKLINDYNNLKDFLINNFNADFSTCHFLSDSFSALQLNITLTDEDNNNLFARIKDEYGDKVESDLLIYSVNGILDNINILLPLYIKNRKCLSRFDFERNNYLYNKGKIPAPTYISWGINNRTASIRIPTPTDFKNYDIIDKTSRRIEFRVPSSDADIKLCVFGVLSSIYYGIENKLDIYKKNNFNILGNNKNLEKIEMKEILMFDKKVYNFLVNCFY